MARFTPEYLLPWGELCHLNPIGTLPEHLYSTLLRYAKTTWKHMKTKGNEFPSLIIARYPVSPSPTPTTHPLHWESQPHPPFLVILCFGAEGDGCAPGSFFYFVAFAMPIKFKATGVYLATVY